MSESRRLILLRHAKSDRPDVPDQDRPLAKRGRRDAPVIGRWLHDHGYLPDTVICSAARRPRQTWKLVAPELGGSPSVTFEPRAYAASAMTLLYLAREKGVPEHGAPLMEEWQALKTKQRPSSATCARGRGRVAGARRARPRCSRRPCQRPR